VFLWLDFRHFGGIIPHDLTSEPYDKVVISRDLKIVRGQGKLIVAACNPKHKAYEESYRLFAEALLNALWERRRIGVR
jgi:hypothetical protein